MRTSTFVYDGLGSCIGIVVQVAHDDVESYVLPGLALIGRYKTRGEAANALAELGLFELKLAQ